MGHGAVIWHLCLPGHLAHQAAFSSLGGDPPEAPPAHLLVLCSVLYIYPVAGTSKRIISPLLSIDRE